MQPEPARPAPAPELSVVVPMYNEEDVFSLFVARLRPTLDALAAERSPSRPSGAAGGYEVLVVDDGSTDSTPILLEKARRDWPQLRVVRLRANSGHQAALSAGLARARGAWVATLDADLQDPPELLRELLAATDPAPEHPGSSPDRPGSLDVVYAVRSDRSSDSVFKRVTAAAYYVLMRQMVGQHVPSDAGDYRLMSRATVDAVNRLPEQHRVLRLAVPVLGFPSTTVPYVREQRAAGATKYGLRKMLALSIDSLTGFSVAPLRLATWAGLLGALAAVLILVSVLAAWAMGNTLPGWTSTLVVVTGVGALQLLALGIMGEYVGRLYVQSQGRASYSVAYDSADES